MLVLLEVYAVLTPLIMIICFAYLINMYKFALKLLSHIFQIVLNVITV